METIALINKVVASNVLSRSMVELPPAGASTAALAEVEQILGVPIDAEYSIFLQTFDGAYLDVIRLYPYQELKITAFGLEFASDPSGFVYYIQGSGEVIVEDTDGGEMKKVASSFDDFIHSYLFGVRSAAFSGEEWHQELVRAGITT